MADIARLHNFNPDETGQPISSQEVDEEFDQLVGRANNVPVDALPAALVEALGVNDGTTVRRGTTGLIGAQETRTSAAFGLLTTPDQVPAVEVEPNGLLVVTYRATWKRTAGAQSVSAGIFLGANQVRIIDVVGAFAQATGTSSTIDTPLSTTAQGLSSGTPPGSPYTGDVGTGQIVSPGAGLGGGFCVIDVDAGVYNVSVQFQAPAGCTVAVKNRRLRVYSVAFA